MLPLSKTPSTRSLRHLAQRGKASLPFFDDARFFHQRTQGLPWKRRCAFAKQNATIKIFALRRKDATIGHLLALAAHPSWVMHGFLVAHPSLAALAFLCASAKLTPQREALGGHLLWWSLKNIHFGGISEEKYPSRP
jgi:hypothetical protein